MLVGRFRGDTIPSQRQDWEHGGTHGPASQSQLGADWLLDREADCVFHAVLHREYVLFPAVNI